MNRLPVALVLALVAVPVLAAEPAKAPAKAAPAKTAAPATATKPAPVPAGWEKVDVTDGGYSLVFPGKPEAQALRTEHGEQVATVYVLERDNGDVAFMASHSDVAKERASLPTKEVLAQAKEGAVRQSQGKLLASKAITFEGNEGLELVIGAPNGMVSYVHVFFVGGRLYQFMAVMPKGHDAFVDVKPFLESFRLIKKS